MFEGWIEDQAKYQSESYGRDLANMNETERCAFMDDMLRAAILEIAEVYEEFSWKSWAKSQFRNQDAVTSELVDVLIFVANALAANGTTSEQLEAKYRSKVSINTARQIDGYDGVSTKCPKCRRALDDEAVTCSPTSCCEDALL